MLTRTVSSFIAAGLIALAAPGVAHAEVADKPASISPSFDNVVRTVAHRGNKIYVGGDFTSVTDSRGTYSRRGAAAIDATTGRVLPWNPRPNGRVRDLAVGADGVYIGGRFTTIRGAHRTNLAKVGLGGVGRQDKGFHPSINGPVKTIALSASRVYIGGEFTRVEGKARAGLAAFKRKGAPRLLPGWRPRVAKGSVLDLVYTRKGVYVAGLFRSLNARAASQRLALVTLAKGRTVRAFNPDMTRPVHDIAVTGKRVYLGIGGQGGGVLSVAKTSGARHWWRRLDGDVLAVAPMAGRVYVGGHFTEICTDPAQGDGGVCLGASENRMRGASLTNGGTLSGWRPEANSLLGITTIQAINRSERLVVGGGFTTMNDGNTQAGRFALFNSPG